MLGFTLFALKMLKEGVFLLLQLFDSRTQHFDLSFTLFLPLFHFESNLPTHPLLPCICRRLQEDRLRVQLIRFFLYLLKDLKFLIGFGGEVIGLFFQSFDEAVIHDSQGWYLPSWVQFLKEECDSFSELGHPLPGEETLEDWMFLGFLQVGQCVILQKFR